MRVIYLPSEVSLTRPLVLTIGVFDGIHRGHLAILSHVLESSQREGMVSCIFTFPYHPSHVLSPTSPVPLLTPLPEKLRIFRQMQIDIVFLVDFKRIYFLSPEEFLNTYLSRLPLFKVVVGENFRFGKDRKGDVELLKKFGEMRSFRVEAFPSFKIDNQVVSSTLIRRLIREGKVEEVEKFLGRYYSVSGKVKKGRGAGRRWGIPTANILLKSYLLPPPGVYAGWTTFSHCRYPSCFDLRKLRKHYLMEVYLIGFEGNLYLRKLRVSFVRFLRERKIFKEDEGRIRQIREDIAIAENILSST